MSKFAMAFIDGQNLFQHAKDAFGYYHPNYDPLKLHHAVCARNGWVPNLVRFYSGVPSEADEPMWGPYWAKRKLIMERAGIKVTTRRLRYREREAYDANGNLRKIRVSQEKGIDTRIVVDVLATARRKEWDVAVIFSQDQDLAEMVPEVMEIGKEQGRDLLVCCAFPSSPHATAKRGIERTMWFRIDKPLYDQCLDPTDYRPSRT